MIKGVSKVELFDAASGRKLHEQVNSNMVTNAIKDIVNCNDKMGLLRWWRTYPVNSTTDKNSAERVSGAAIHAISPIIERGLGGVMLWDDNITEDPNIVTRPQGVREVGHAGDPYSGTDVYRGSLNVNETCAIDGGKRYVWDFGTDKANGTIKCLSLTSCNGGNIGIHGCFDGNPYPIINNCYFSSANGYGNITSCTSYLETGGMGSGAKVFYMERLSDGSLKFYVKRKKNIVVFTCDDPEKLSISNSTLQKTEQVIFTDLRKETNEMIYVYQGNIHEIDHYTNQSLIHRVISKSGALISESVIPVPRTINMSSSNRLTAIYRDGYYYLLANFSSYYNYISKIDAQGSETAQIELPGSLLLKDVFHGNINEYNNDIYLNVFTNSSGSYYGDLYVLHDDDTLSHCNSTSYGSIPSSNMSPNEASDGVIATNDMNSPFVFTSDNNSNTGNMHVFINTGYIATINNLKTPIVKTAAQTMKITYEIHEE